MIVEGIFWRLQQRCGCNECENFGELEFAKLAVGIDESSGCEALVFWIMLV